MPFSPTPDLIAILDGLAQGILIFGPDGKLVLANLAARMLLGADLDVIRQTGFSALVVLLDRQLPDGGITLEQARQQALAQEKPVRFRTFRAGEFQPCLVSGLHDPHDIPYVMISLETPDWDPVDETMTRFGSEIAGALDSAKGHTDLIQQVIDRRKPNETADQVAKRLSGFNKLIQVQMIRSQRLLGMMNRLTDLRIGVLREQVEARLKPFDLSMFLEDLTEEINQSLVVDPETDAGDIRSRLRVSIADGLRVEGSTLHLTRVLHDILANAIMYSLRATPIGIMAQRKGSFVQIDIQDEGYGIRETEHDRVFTPFQRGRQPQIISEFGYGLAIYLCKHEVEAMNGRIWFDSAEGIGTTFSIALPVSSSSSGKP
jgi:signal transduction histidine kinase